MRRVTAAELEGFNMLPLLDTRGTAGFGASVTAACILQVRRGAAGGVGAQTGSGGNGGVPVQAAEREEAGAGSP